MSENVKSGGKRGKRAGQGSHGSTTKAGKVRAQTPKIPPSSLVKSKTPRVNARRRYHRVFELERKLGQDWDFIEGKKKVRN